MGKAFEVRFAGMLPAAPEDVWAAITTGTAGWLWPITYEPRLGGSEVGVTDDGGTVTAWDPPHHFATHGESTDGWHNTLDYLLEARDCGTFLRFTQSGVIFANWDNEYDGCRQHTDFYYHSLGQYLLHFKGRPAAYVAADGAPASADPGSFETLRRALGLTHRVSSGDQVSLQGPGPTPLAGIVDYLTPNFLGLRTADALYRFYGRGAFGWPVGIGHHLFADNADPETATHAWRAWLEEIYP
jgi:uncharacterized protein YndB with AHSA1/START domain